MENRKKNIVCCSELQCAVVCCSVLQRVAVCCSVLQLYRLSRQGVCNEICCSAMQCVAACCSMLKLQVVAVVLLFTPRCMNRAVL